MKYLTTLLVVTAVHLVAIGGIVFFTTSTTAKAKEIEGDKKALEDSYSYKYVGIDGIVPSKPEASAVPTPTPKPEATPVPRSEPSPNDWPRAKVHVVSKGDTFYGLVKKYNLNAEKFKKVNNIKDPSKIILGKKLILP
jgi:LysM repeat protein